MSDQYTEARNKFLAAVKAGLEDPVACVHVIPVQEEDVDAALTFAKAVRSAGVSCIVDTRTTKIKKKFGHASDTLAFFVAVIGADERAQGAVTLRDLDERSQQMLPVGDAIRHLAYMCRSQR